MSELMKGNFEVKRKLDVPDVSDNSADFKNEFKKKALESIGGSMVFVEREMLFWESTESTDGE
ncbi:hypothetical protein [Methylobacter tundripaludum]|uniref:hypothetical protein n=1 Tax=Methylobacter tundripaludum TaxID=173365 RepID=UPI0004DEEB50|nr:hypothetical protein [Methylobacter tundripaludum]